jgi:hypothetical protein
MRMLAVTAAVVAVASITSPAFAKTAGAMGAAAATGSTEQVKPKDDATVRSVPAVQNFGRQPTLRISGGTVVERAYLRFDLRDVDGGIASAQLRVYSHDGSPVGFDVRTSDASWSERTITWANAPAPSHDVVGSSGRLRPNAWATIDLSSAIAGNRWVSLVLTTTSRDPITLASEESDDRDPVLLVRAGRVNRPPTAVDDTALGLEATPLAIPSATLVANDSDPDGNALSVSAVAATADTNGTVSLDAGTVRYTPAAGFLGAASFAYTVSDGNGGTATATVHVTVANVPPTASGLSASTGSGLPVQVALSATDPGSPPETLTFALAGDGSHGHATIAGSTATYTPDATFSGTDSFTYTASDGNGSTSAPATVTVAVVNHAPTASGGSATTDAGQAVQVTLSATDPEAPPQVLSFAIANDATSGHATVSGSTATYTPNAGFTGTDSFTYTASDGAGGTSAPATVTVTVRSAAPTAGDVQLSADSNAPTTLQLSTLAAQLNDPDGETMTVSSVSGGADTHGDVRIVGDRVVYTPDGTFAGDATFAYTGTDGNGDSASGTVDVTVDHQPAFPLRASFYYPWFPEAWTQQGLTPFTHYTPTLGFYSSSDTATVDAHLAAMSSAHVDSAIASWWGQGAKSEDTRIPLLLSRIASTHSSLRLALYYEPEGQGDPSVAQIVSDLQYIQSRYASDPGYLRIGGRFVVFAYDGGPSDGATSCEMTERWKQANDQIGDAAFVVLKVFTGFKSCGSQPDGWHQYAPSNAESPQTPWSYAISPGFWLATDATPRLARNPSAWSQDVLDMLNSDAAFQLVTTFNEWGEGTAVESSTTWGTTYLDALAANGGGFPTAVAPGSPNPGPTLAGVVAAGRSLTVVPGSWPGTPGTFTYQFRRCDSAGGSCVDIPGATSGSYVLGPEDVGTTIRALVTDTNAAGAKSSLSEPSAIVPTDGLPSTAGTCGTQAAPPATWSHVVWIFFENHSYNQVVGSASAPYLTALANACGLATNYAGVAHPSLPNYIAATSGGTQGITDDNPPTSANHYLNVPNIYQQVQATGGTWRDFEESSPSNCPNGSSGLYAVKHDPAAYYSNIATTCANWDVPLGSLTGGNFPNALLGGLPTFSFVTPNLCNDAHDCSIASGDDWLRAWLPRLLASPDYRSGSTAVFITFDENDNSTGNIVPAVVISPSTAAGTVSSAAFNHYSLLRTSEDLLGLTPIGNAATAPSMAPAFGLR